VDILDGQVVNLRNMHCLNLGRVDDSTAEPPVFVEEAKRKPFTDKPKTKAKEQEGQP
jgi:hypothetical protein